MRLSLFCVLFCLVRMTFAETLTILNWEEYLSEKAIEDWENQSGHQIKQIYFDNDEDRDNVVINHKDKVIDLVIIDEIASRTFGEKGRLLPVAAYKNTPNIKAIDSSFQKSCGNYSIPYLWGTLGIAYRTDKINNPPKSWEFLLNPSKAMEGHIGLLDDFADTLAPALLYKNLSINTDDPSDLKNAFEMIKSMLPSVLTFEYGISYIGSHEKSDELFAVLAYSGDQYSLNEKTGKEVWEFTTLEEGTIAWVDCIALMNDSPRQAIALDFLNYLNSAEVAAENSETVYAASPLASARSLQSKEFLNDETVYPPKSIMDKAQHYELLSPENILLRNRITSSLIKIHESK